MRAVHSALLTEIIHLMPNTLLDIGCGSGVFTSIITAALPSIAISATDTSPKRFVPIHNATFKKGSAENLPFDEGVFDMVIAAQSLHHWADKGKGIKEAYRVLKNGGQLLIGDPLLEDWMSKKFWGWLMQKIDRGSFSDAQRLQGYLSKAGFESIRIELIPNSMRSLYLISAKKN